MEQIFELAMLHGVRVMGVATTDDHRVRTVFLEAPSYHKYYGDVEEKGQLGARYVIALGKVLIEFGEAMLSGELRHDANKS